jgi:L-fuculose-phosphate aldolase
VRYPELRRAVVEAFRFMEERGLNWGYSGNISLRLPEEGLYLISPSGVKKSKIAPEDLVIIDEGGRVVEGSRAPSIEYRMHLAVYRVRRDVNAVVHAHPLYASVFAALRRRIEPVVEELTIYLGGPVEVAEYAPPGTEELAENVVRALGDRSAVILANHGALTCGSSLEEALDALVYLERAALISALSSLLGGAHPLPEEVLELEREIYLARRGVA